MRPLWKRATLFPFLDLGWVADFQVTAENIDPDPRLLAVPTTISPPLRVNYSRMKGVIARVLRRGCRSG